MIGITKIKYPRQPEFVSPGIVGSVGDALGQTRLKQSAPDLPIRLQYSGDQIEHFGSNVQNGTVASFEGGGVYEVFEDSVWGSGRDFRTNVGWHHQDLRAPDKRYESAVAPSFSNFDNLAHSIFEARRTGDKFLPLPHGYEPTPGVQPRGGSTPIVSAIAGGDFTQVPNAVITNPQVDVNRSDLRRPLPQPRSINNNEPSRMRGPVGRF